MINDIKRNNENISVNHKEIEVLKTYFPACFKKDGSFDLERFKEDLKTKVDIVHEGYELKFLGKSYAKLLSSLDTTTVITPNDAHNNLAENKGSENIYISGDNLDGLKHLLKSYSQRVKCIYIDPPYNTGSDGFVYKDNFNFTIDELQDKLSIDETQAKRILDLTKRESSSHSAWLMFMFSRLQLAKDLLSPDGVIFISIDNNEQANLKLLCDDVFGEENFIETFLWTKTSTPPSLSTKSRKTNEYVICYERYKNSIKYNGEKLDGNDQPLLNTGNIESVLKFPKDKINFSLKHFPNGIYKPYKPDRVSLMNEIEIENGYSNVEVLLKGPFKWTQENLNEEIKLGTTFIVKSDILSVRFLNTKEGFKRPTNFIKEKIFTTKIDKKENGVGTNENASSEIDLLFGTKVFDFTKPISLIEYLINFVTSDNDIICDFFSGSGSTAHAVLELNAMDGGNRKFISIQLPEQLNSKEISQKNSFNFLTSVNHPTTLDYIGFERIIRAAKKIKEETQANIHYGFKHFILNEPNQNTLDKCENFDKATLFADSTILEDFGIDTILTTWLNSDGYGLNPTIQKIDINGYTAYFCGKHLYLINPQFTHKSIASLFEMYDANLDFNPENIIIFGYSFEEWSISEMLDKNLKILNSNERNLKINIEVRY